jgi:hypothetical protein
VPVAGRRWSRSSTRTRCRRRCCGIGKSGEGNDVGVSASARSIVCADAIVVGGIRIQTRQVKVRGISNIEILVAGYVTVERPFRRNIEAVTGSITCGVPICREAVAGSVRRGDGDRRGGG